MPQSEESGSGSNDSEMGAAVEKLLDADKEGNHIDRVSKIIEEVGITSLLHHAAQTGHRALLEILLEDPTFEVNAREGLMGCTALIIACWKGHTEMVRLLLQNGADVLIGTRDGLTCLHMAAFCGHTNLLLHGKSQRKRLEEWDPLEVPMLSSNRRWALIGRKTSIETFTALHMAASGNHSSGVPIVASILETFRTAVLDFHGLAPNSKTAYDIQTELWMNFLLKIRRELHTNGPVEISDQLLLKNVVGGGGSALQQKLDVKYEGILLAHVERTGLVREHQR